MKDKLIKLYEKLLLETKNMNEVSDQGRFYRVETNIDGVSQRMEVFKHIGEGLGQISPDQYSINYKEITESISEDEYDKLVNLHKQRVSHFEELEKKRRIKEQETTVNRLLDRLS